MSTRGIIAERDDAHGGFRGRYHHWDSYPKGLGKSLYAIYHEVFEKDLDAMLRVLLYEHTAGWSTIQRDWACPIGYGSDGPACYCHGSRNEPSRDWIYADSASCAEFVYVIDKAKRVMTIFERQYNDGGHAMGFFGIPIDDNETSWKEVAVVSFDGPEPDWDKISAF